MWRVHSGQEKEEAGKPPNEKVFCQEEDKKEAEERLEGGSWWERDGSN